MGLSLRDVAGLHCAARPMAVVADRLGVEERAISALIDRIAARVPVPGWVLPAHRLLFLAEAEQHGVAAAEAAVRRVMRPVENPDHPPEWWRVLADLDATPGEVARRVAGLWRMVAAETGVNDLYGAKGARAVVAARVLLRALVLERCGVPAEQVAALLGVGPYAMWSGRDAMREAVAARTDEGRRFVALRDRAEAEGLWPVVQVARVAQPDRPMKDGRRSVPRLIAMVAEHYGLEAEDLLGASREGDVIAARHRAVWVIWRATAVPLKRIAEAMRRDNGTIHHALNKVRTLRARDAAYAAETDALAEAGQAVTGMCRAVRL